MNILGFDTCLDKMYVSGKFNDKLLSSKIIENTQEHYHSAYLISTIRDFLKENALTPQDIDAITINIGPGSFTGIRACTTVARVFAQGVEVNKNGLKTVGISSLEILSRLSKHQKTMVALDARKNMAYVAIFGNKNEIFAPKALPLDEVKDMIAQNDYEIITDDKLQLVLGGTSYQSFNDDLGQYLIQIAEEKLVSGYDTNWRKLLPLYIQPPPVTIKK